MSRLKPSLLLIFLLATFIANAQFTDVINSNRPGKSMAAFSVGKTVIQAEGGFYGVDEKYDFYKTDATGLGGELALRYGAFFEQLEFILEAQYQHDHVQTDVADFTQKGIKQMTIGAKYLFFDPNKNYEKKPDLYSWKKNHSFSWHEFIPAVGIYAGLNLNVFNGPYINPSEGKISPKIMVLTQNQFGKWALVGNFGLDRIATNYMSYGYILTVTRGFNERWSGFIENQGIQSDAYADMIFRVGAAYLIKENIQVDASFGINVKDTPAIMTGGIGVSWRFDANYDEVILRAPKAEKSKSDKKKDKKKAQAKKRLDEVEGQEKTK